jgi:hypothetical protein
MALKNVSYSLGPVQLRKHGTTPLEDVRGFLLFPLVIRVRTTRQRHCNATGGRVSPTRLFLVDITGMPVDHVKIFGSVRGLQS